MGTSKKNGRRRAPGKGRTTEARPSGGDPSSASPLSAHASGGIDRLLGAAAVERLLATPSPASASASAGPTRPTSSARRDLAHLSPVRAGCSIVHELTPHTTAVAYTFRAKPDGQAYDVPLRVIGRLIEADTAAEDPSAPDRFDRTHVVRSVEPGVGDVTVTIRIPGVRPGRWDVRVLDAVHDETYETEVASGYGRVLAEAGPGVSLGAWPATVAVGAVLGVALLGWLAGREGLEASAVISLAVIASLIGVVGARVYYLAQSTQRVGLLSSAGMCIQGFVIAALATLFLGAPLLALPPLVLADVAAPGLMLGMAIGRLGCFYGGCCTGRMSRRRGALRSSDRYLLVRRIPVQLIEGAVSAVLGLIALAVLLTRDAHPAGVLALATIGAYVLARQLLFSLRSTPRRTRVGRPAVGALSAAVAAVSATVLLTH